VLDVIKAPNAQHLHLIDLKAHTTNIKDISELKIDINFRANVSRNHTTEHLLEHVLNKTIDSSIKQEGAFKTDTYFTFDFKYSQKLTPEQIRMVEDKVNDIINSSKSVSTTVKSHEEATQNNTVGHFTEKYKTIKGGLRVVNIDSINDEICGGTHVNNTSDIQKFMIVEYIQKGNGT
jgi:alanyl-tRNA synthetase